MSYQDRAALAVDYVFIGRLNACCYNEALLKTGDFADKCLAAAGWAGAVFTPSIVAQPGFDVPQDQITDGQLLAGVQSCWARVEAINTPAA
jgi:hypothetical protein